MENMETLSTSKERGIDNTTEWVEQASLRIKDIMRQKEWNEPALLYTCIATDTPSMISKFRHELQGVMAVVEFPQERLGEGDGIFFGEQGKTPNMTNHQCIRQWENAVADMILLLHADALIAGRMSSFVQTKPMSLLFGRPPAETKVSTPMCELNLNASDIICSKMYMEWCCEIRDRPHFRPRPDSHMLYYWKTQAYEKKTSTMA